MSLRSFLTVVMISASVGASAQEVVKTFRSEQRFALASGGLLVLENPVGSIHISGADVDGAEGIVTRMISGPDEKAIEEGRRQTNIVVGGNAKKRTLRATVSPEARTPWSAAVNWNLKVPRNVSLQIVSLSSRKLHITDVRGQIHVKTFHGAVLLERVEGPAVVQNTNGPIVYSIASSPRANTVLSTVNGDVTVRIGAGADFRWVAETAKGDIRTNMPARGAFFGTTFRGSVNAGGPTITTATLIGNIHLLASGTPVRTAESLRRVRPELAATPAASPAAGAIGNFTGFFRYRTNLGDVRVQQIRGDADITTGAGEVQLGAVSGSCTVVSGGGPLQIGEASGPVNLETRAGDVLVDTAHRGGSIRTTGGTIRVLYTGGPTQLESGGGDVVVRQAAGPIDAKTLSGDIVVTVDPTARTQQVSARTEGGNIVLNIPRGFGADVDAVIITSDPKADTILSEIPGLTVTRESAGAKTRVRASGKLNGGGDRVFLRAIEGDIRISVAEARPTVVQTR
jgi:DUF4097 and DUF4098 domain-containing protein YvlB